MKKTTLFVILLTFWSFKVCGAEQTASHQCGDAEVNIKAQDRAEYGSSEFDEVNITVTKGSELLKVKEENDFFTIACIKDKKNNNFIIYQSYCGGTVCKDLDNYGIIDTKKLKFLLKPSDDNRKKAGKLVGMPPQELNDKVVNNAFFPK